ncbi:transcriptional regulator (plasmid) [Streptomyces sp. NBC_01558]|uniref:transcriptional regulator n=1 Tax=Streptomyces sp. NBC_01558 TaxID=2975878 RepID=UPI002DDB21E7|nr:transcriptional regulator [Streptomyces sp. NBC_01558]WSD82743.1 transcriptional regulator [Streptomyces sp. NBC_01558]
MTDDLDDAFRTANRLRIAAFLSGCDEAEFRAVQDYCDLSPSNLSKNIAALEELDYVAVRKGHVGKTPRTWLALTDKGRKALAAHLAALQNIAATAARHA